MTTKGKTKKPAAKKAAPEVAQSAGKFIADSKIKVLVDTNPKREGSASYKRFAIYKSGMTVAEAIAKGLTRPDLNWDVDHQFISIG
jgi:hypothetical protein